MFQRFEMMIAWRYLRARRSEGGISVMTWISLIGIALAVFALIATLAVRTGLREETVDIILGASAHLEVRQSSIIPGTDILDRRMVDYAETAARIAEVPGVTGAVPVVTGRIIADFGPNNSPVEIYGIAPSDLAEFEAIASPEASRGDLSRLPEGIALADGVARALNADIGDRIRIISPNGVRTAMGTSPRISAYEVVYIFRSGQYFLDSTRAYLPLDVAQPFFNRDGVVDKIDVMLDDPETVDERAGAVLTAAGPTAYGWTWRDRAGGQLRALELQDSALYILLFILVLIATLNIVSGLIMLVKNKGRDIGILRTIGLSQGSILRIFVLVGASVGVAGTLLGTAMGIVFSLNIEHIYALTDLVVGRGREQLEAQGIFFPPAVLRPGDLLAAVGLSLALSFVVTIFPARRAARMNPVEALRYE